MPSRHIDDGTSIYSFTNLFLVRCPKCESCARVIRIGDEIPSSYGKLTCTSCGYFKETRLLRSKDARISQPIERVPCDWYFELPLWLQSPCCGHILWAFNLDHLSFLESYIDARHRVGLRGDEAERMGIRNATLASRLPEWMIVAKHREDVLQGIRKLRVGIPS